MKYLFLITISFTSCNTEIRSIEKWKSEIVETEKNFSEMAKQEGVSKAFLAFAAEDAVLNRNDNLIIGMEALKKFLERQSTNDKNITLSWEPDFVDVASSGDLGYTYGQYVYSFLDSAGNKTESTGVFHTVWKRQPDGDWKFVWD